MGFIQSTRIVSRRRWRAFLSIHHIVVVPKTYLVLRDIVSTILSYFVTSTFVCVFWHKLCIECVRRMFCVNNSGFVIVCGVSE